MDLSKHKGKRMILKSWWTNATRTELYQKKFREGQTQRYKTFFLYLTKV